MLGTGFLHQCYEWGRNPVWVLAALNRTIEHPLCLFPHCLQTIATGSNRVKENNRPTQPHRQLVLCLCGPVVFFQIVDLSMSLSGCLASQFPG